MKIQSIQDSQHFNGNIYVGTMQSLNRKHQKVFDKIELSVLNMFKDKNYSLNIDGNRAPSVDCIHIDCGKKARFVNFKIIPNPTIVDKSNPVEKTPTKPFPQVMVLTDSLNPKVWLAQIKHMMKEYEASPLYERGISQTEQKLDVILRDGSYRTTPKVGMIEKIKQGIKKYINS